MAGYGNWNQQGSAASERAKWEQEREGLLNTLKNTGGMKVQSSYADSPEFDIRRKQLAYLDAQPGAARLAAQNVRNRAEGKPSVYGGGMNAQPMRAAGLQQPQAAMPAATAPAMGMPQAPAMGMRPPAQDAMSAYATANSRLRRPGYQAFEGAGQNFASAMKDYGQYQTNYDTPTGMPSGLQIGREDGQFYGQVEFQPGGEMSKRLKQMNQEAGAGGLRLDATPRNVMPSNNEPSFYDLYMRDPAYQAMGLDQKLKLRKDFDAQYKRPERMNNGQATYQDFMDIISGGRKSNPGNTFNEQRAMAFLQAQNNRGFDRAAKMDDSARSAAGLNIDAQYKFGQLNNDRDRMGMDYAQGMAKQGGSGKGGLQGFNPNELPVINGRITPWEEYYGMEFDEIARSRPDLKGLSVAELTKMKQDYAASKTALIKPLQRPQDIQL